MPDLTTIGVITGIVAGIGALALGIWNRIEQWRESRTRHNARKPHFAASVSHPDNEGWRPIHFTFHNPAELSFNVEFIEVTTAVVHLAPVLEPGVGPGPYGGIGTAPNTSLAGQVISVAWTIDSGANPSRSPSHRIFCRPYVHSDFILNPRHRPGNISKPPKVPHAGRRNNQNSEPLNS